jgi:NADPH:quinone reductase-like Zn-dependent oxidoreductase
MKQAQILTWGSDPTLVDLPTPTAPAPDSDLVQVKVQVAGLHPLVRLRASGTHYSASVLPHILGTDGVGTTPDGSLVYFSALNPPGGSFTEYITLPRMALAPVPPGADAVQVAGLMNPTFASWMAFSARVTLSLLPKDFTVAIIGASSTAGTVAISISRIFGAGKIVGIARSKAKMAGLGLDEIVEIDSADGEKTDFGPALHADVILDFLYGPAALGLLKGIKPGKPVQYVQIGSSAAPTVTFPGDLLRGKDVTMRGTGPGAWTMPQLAEQVPKMVAAIADGRIKRHEFAEIKLSELPAVWNNKGERMVVVMKE